MTINTQNLTLKSWNSLTKEKMAIRIIEGKISCPITKNNNIEDIILINFKQKLIRYEN